MKVFDHWYYFGIYNTEFSFSIPSGYRSGYWTYIIICIHTFIPIYVCIHTSIPIPIYVGSLPFL